MRSLALFFSAAKARVGSNSCHTSKVRQNRTEKLMMQQKTFIALVLFTDSTMVSKPFCKRGLGLIIASAGFGMLMADQRGLLFVIINP